ncbi:uncharacterized protein STEHIDRAFT_159609 [Stereum hirsutum FP-91666 SS1]|uniref:uncharacterized protein n=1 Tax=Stereum hirsutum (strain FP-91666) TaxID=721885 RepID=UPI000444958A|nr:uncharacterized protein STEHIDRAFT_159609 [Stereum hirsutum FP-91666 SS1]EIM84003.1 hypothetical protein STEHIDRAFT_159609 [Stereum hirsutum FP-91666 SS1]
MSSENVIVMDSDNSHIREEWEQKVLGKKIVDDATSQAEGGDSNTTSVPTFAKSDLPPSNRVLTPNGIMTMDYRFERFVDLPSSTSVHAMQVHISLTFRTQGKL